MQVILLGIKQKVNKKHVHETLIVSSAHGLILFITCKNCPSTVLCYNHTDLTIKDVSQNF